MLTERIIREAKPGLKTYILWDATVKGLGLRITSKGVKSYILNYRIHGRERRATLARASEISLKIARERAGDQLVRIRAGEADPLDVKRAARDAPTVADVTREQVEQMVATLPGAQRNRVLAFASRVFSLFEQWDFRPQRTNPCYGIERAREQPRDRVLSPSEVDCTRSGTQTARATAPHFCGGHPSDGPDGAEDRRGAGHPLARHRLRYGAADPAGNQDGATRP